MLNEQLKKNIAGCIYEGSGIDILSIDPNSDWRERISIDSLQFVAIASRLEKLLQVELPISIIEANSVNEFFQIINQELARADKLL